MIRDIEILPQDAMQYVLAERVPAGEVDKPLLASEKQAAMVRHLRVEFFAPWSGAAARTAPAEAETTFAQFRAGEYFDEQGHRREQARFDGLQSQAAMADFGRQAATPALTLRRTLVRELPTLEPCYRSSAGPGGGPPFDMLQNTALPPGTPLLLVHRAGAWSFVESAQGRGWIPAKDFCVAGEELRRTWQARPLVAIAEDAPTITGGDYAPCRPRSACSCRCHPRSASRRECTCREKNSPTLPSPAATRCCRWR